MIKNLSIHTWITAIALGSILMIVACGDDDTNVLDDEPNDSAEFDRTQLLESLADSLIIPNFESLQGSINSLNDAILTFNGETTQQNLEAAKSAWEQAAIDFQHTSAFGFGPGEVLLGPFTNILGVFPVDEDLVEQRMLEDNFDLSNSFDLDIRGLYTIEYLLYGDPFSTTDIVANFDQDRKDYLLLIITEVKTTVDEIVAEWNSTYRAQFIVDNSTSAGSAISLLYNEFVKDYEIIKNLKIELPAGLTAGIPQDPTFVEAYYSGISSTLIEENFESSKNIYFGRTREGLEFTGFDAYLESVVGGADLVAETIPVVAQIDQTISALPSGRLSENLDDSNVTLLRNQLQDNTKNFKSSMSSLLGISITFNSGDGD
ncbi:MAG: imelysin family protein [Bacteroidota bacterium]